MTTPEVSVALELERLRGTCETGFTRVDGQLALLVQRGDQTDKDIAELKAEVEALKRARWPLPSIAAVVSVSALGVTLWQAAGR
ncbi:hypothetical protein CFC35_05850 [Streptomyces sp. FBKL.4005]|uniref:hypothetical protein n=1 Tax=Streptomyces sp. FBKL.4005 TaxID=2015515 RepID=UPI000A394707|nr:hypothetical protein [Streptomyces sp. FBKL.4005]OYP14088.1 hypothetical protein CFC35_05850 [Streptomyces sp. FBKL.4005]